MGIHIALSAVQAIFVNDDRIALFLDGLLVTAVFNSKVICIASVQELLLGETLLGRNPYKPLNQIDVLAPTNMR